MNGPQIAKTVALLLVTLTMFSCKSNSTTEPTPLAPSQSVIINGTTYQITTVQESMTSGLYEIEAYSSSGGSTLTLDFASYPSSTSTYTAAKGLPSGLNCVVSMVQGTKTYAAMSGGSVAVTVAGSAHSYSFNNMTMSNPLNSSEMITVSANMTQ